MTAEEQARRDAREAEATRRATRHGPTPYQRILRAAPAGRGVRLSADDVWRLAQDDAIRARAEIDDDPEHPR
jgi:hypothetical protein